MVTDSSSPSWYARSASGDVDGLHTDGISSNFDSECQAELGSAQEDGLSDDGTIDEDGSSCRGSGSRGRNSNSGEQELPSIAEHMVTAGYGKSVFELQENIS